MSITEKIQKIAGNKNLSYVLKSFAKTTALHPLITTRETSKFLARWAYGRREQPQQGLRFEHHCHSNFSDGAELSDIVELLLDKQIPLWSLTDHGNSNAFDSLKNGSYKLQEKSKTGRKYELELHPDGRAMTIHSGEQQIILLRSIELWTDKGEICIHGYRGEFAGKRPLLCEAIQKGKDMGGFIVINHPYFWEGIGYYGRKYIEQAIQKGAIAIERNGTEIPPQIHSSVKAEIDSKEFGIPLVTSGDAHQLYMYGLSGLTFEQEDYEHALKKHQGNHPDTIKFLITSTSFETYLNYLTPKEFLKFFSFGNVKSV